VAHLAGATEKPEAELRMAHAMNILKRMARRYRFECLALLLAALFVTFMAGPLLGR
jgi:hypothetical protein